MVVLHSVISGARLNRPREAGSGPGHRSLTNHRHELQSKTREQHFLTSEADAALQERPVRSVHRTLLLSVQVAASTPSHMTALAEGKQKHLVPLQ